MKKSILCCVGWHKWSEKEYSIKYAVADKLYQSTSVHCLRPTCGGEKSFERRV